MANIDFQAVGTEILDGMKAVAEPHLGKFESWAHEDQEWLKEQAAVSGQLLQDMAHAVALEDEDQQRMIRDAMEQHASTLKLRWVRRRVEASREAQEAVGEAIEAGLKVALKVGLALITGGLVA